MPIIRLMFLLFLALVYSPAFAKEPAKPELVLGIFPYVTPAQLMEFHSPLRDYLSKVLGQPVVLVTAPDFQNFVERTRQGQYDIILAAPHMGRLAETRDGYMRLAQTGHTVQGIFLARKDSSIYKIEDLKGKTLMMAQPIAIIYQMSNRLLREKGLVPGETITIIDTRTHNNAMYAPLRGEADASVTGILLWEVIGQEQKDQMRVIGTTEKAPGFMLMANKRLGDKIVGKLSKALLDFKQLPESQAYFSATGYEGFQKIDDKVMKSMDSYTQVLKTTGGP